MKLEILQCKNIKELTELIAVFENVFIMKNFKRPNKLHLKHLLNNDTFYAIIAKYRNKVIAGLTLYKLDQYYSQKPLAYIFDVAVLAEHQRKGIGRKLIAFTKEFCIQKGFEEVFVQADKVDDYAIDFYRSTKPTKEEQVIHFNYKL